MKLSRCGVVSMALFPLLLVISGCSEQHESIAESNGDASWYMDARTVVDLGTLVDEGSDNRRDADRVTDAVVELDAGSGDALVMDAAVVRVEAFSIGEANERIERDCSGCHATGGTGSSRRLGWDNMSYQLVYLSVKDPWTASSTRMPQGGEYWSETDIERIRLLYVSERERSEVD